MTFCEHKHPVSSNFQFRNPWINEAMANSVAHCCDAYFIQVYAVGGLSLLIPLAFSHASYHMFHIVSLCFQCFPCFSHISWRIRSWRITQDLEFSVRPGPPWSTSLAARRARLAPWSHVLSIYTGIWLIWWFETTWQNARFYGFHGIFWFQWPWLPNQNP